VQLVSWVQCSAKDKEDEESMYCDGVAHGGCQRLQRLRVEVVVVMKGGSISRTSINSRIQQQESDDGCSQNQADQRWWHVH